MQGETRYAQNRGSELNGEIAPLAAQLGAMAGRCAFEVVSASGQNPVTSRSALQAQLQSYASQVFPVELGAIHQAFLHASRAEVRELIALDQQLSRESALAPYAEASQRTGRAHLQQLRPLRDQRLVQRYLKAIETGQAGGWHLLSFGVTMAVYSLPLRQSLLEYAQRSLRCLIELSARTLGLSLKEIESLVANFSSPLPGLMDSLFRNSNGAQFRAG